MKNNESSGYNKLCVCISILALLAASVAYFCPKESCRNGNDSGFAEKVKGIVIDVVKEDPQLFMDAMGEGIAKKRDEAVKQLAASVGEHKEEINGQSMKFGKVDSKKTIICFFDPMCKHCVEFQKSMIKLIESNKDICFKLLPVAVLGEDSVILAKIYISVYNEGSVKALKFIKEIISSSNEMDKTAIESALKKTGFDSKKIEEMMAESDKKLAANGALAEKLKLPVVPAIFVSDGSKVVAFQSPPEPGLLVTAVEDLTNKNSLTADKDSDTETSSTKQN